MDVRFQIILFNRSVEVLAGSQGAGLLPATMENKRRVADFLRTVLPEGGTQPVPALKRAMALRPDAIYFVTDAEEMSARDLREVTLLNQGHSVIQVVAFDNEHPSLTLKALAQNNRGQIRVDSAAPQSALSPNGN